MCVAVACCLIPSLFSHLPTSPSHPAPRRATWSIPRSVVRPAQPLTRNGNSWTRICGQNVLLLVRLLTWNGSMQSIYFPSSGLWREHNIRHRICSKGWVIHPKHFLLHIPFFAVRCVPMWSDRISQSYLFNVCQLSSIPKARTPVQGTVVQGEAN